MLDANDATLVRGALLLAARIKREGEMQKVRY